MKSSIKINFYWIPLFNLKSIFFIGCFNNSPIDKWWSIIKTTDTFNILYKSNFYFFFLVWKVHLRRQFLMKDEVRYEFDDHYFEFSTIINNQRIYQLKQTKAKKLTTINTGYLQSIWRFGSFCNCCNEWNFPPNVRFNWRNFLICSSLSIFDKSLDLIRLSSSIKLISVGLNRNEK